MNQLANLARKPPVKSRTIIKDLKVLVTQTPNGALGVVLQDRNMEHQEIDQRTDFGSVRIDGP